MQRINPYPMESQTEQVPSGMESMEIRYPISYSAKDLHSFTQRFIEENLIGNTQYAVLYRGKIPRGSNQTEDKKVTVKLWVAEGPGNCGPDYQKQRLEDEICFLQQPSMNNHPNLPKLTGYIVHGSRYGVVYDLNPIDTLQNLVAKDSFSWIQRINVAIALARLLDFLHSCEPPYKVCNLAAAHILIDQDFNPILVDFGMLSGGVLGDRPNLPGRVIFGAYGYVDRQYASIGYDHPGKRDVYAFGVLLLNLIAKRVVVKEYPWDPWIEDWATFEFKRQGACSLVHESLQSESAYEVTVGYAVTMLAMRCIDLEQYRRPTMSEIVHFLEDLLVAGSHGEVTDAKWMSDDAQSVGSLSET